jgi:ketosteroid isomerase-like protein
MVQRVSDEVLDRLRMEERFECWNRGEFDLMLEPYAEDALFDISAVFTDVSPVRGHADMRRSWEDLRETWQGLRLDPVEVLEVGEGRFVVDLRLSGKGRGSGAEVEQRFAMLYDVDPAGRVVSARLLANMAAAISVVERSPSEAA